MRQITGILLLAAICAACSAQNSNTAPNQKQETKEKEAFGSVMGTAYCSDTNAPARRAAILLIPASGQDIRRMLAGTTDLEGRFTIRNVPEGTYYISTLLAGYLNPMPASTVRKLSALSEDERKQIEAQAVKVTVSGKEAASISVRLERAAEIDGTVLWDDGSPAIGLQIHVQPKPAQNQQDKAPSNPTYAGYLEFADQRTRQTDDHGRFRLLGISPGEYLISVQVPTPSEDGEQQNWIVMAVESSPLGSLTVYYGDAFRTSQAKPIKIEGGEAFGGADITIPLSKLHTLRGHVSLKSTGQPPASAALQLLYADTREIARFAVAINGDFEFPYVPEGSFVLQAGAGTDRMSFNDDLDGDAGMELVANDGELFAVPRSIKLSGAAEIPLDVHADLDNVLIAVPDPISKFPGTTSAASQ
jgi:hypothetical protein